MAPRVLVVYFSRTGHTRTIAEQVAAALGADVEPIAEASSRLGLLGFERSGFQAFLERVVDIEPSTHDPAAYDLLVIGTPIWDLSLASPVRSYLRRHRARLPDVAFFCTCGGLGMARVFEQMARECRKEPKARMFLREADLELAAPAVARFVQSLAPGAAGALHPPL